MAYFHKQLTPEKWNSLTKAQQILNIASELTRAKNLIEKKDEKHLKNSLERSFELIDLTSQDKKWQGNSLKELRRLREKLGEFFVKTESSVHEFKYLLRSLLNFCKESSVVELF